MDKIKELLELIWINIRVTAGNLLEWTKVACKYYGNAQFLKADLSLTLMYLFHNPYSISKRFLMKRGEQDPYKYGETPLTTLDYITKQANISSTDHLFELGSGRGRACFWCNAFLGCEVTGIEYIPEFVERSLLIKNKLKLDKVHFRQEDMLRADFTGATVVYLYGSSLDEKSILALAAKFDKMPKGTKVITVSYPLNEYLASKSYELMKRFPAKFPWGVADIYLQVKK